MKYSIIFSLTLIFLSASITPLSGQKKSKERDLFEVEVDGLGCPFCAYGLEKKIKEFKKIKDIKIDMETGDFSFTSPTENALTLVDVEAKIDKAGYTPIALKVTRADGTVEVGEELKASDKIVKNSTRNMSSDDEVYENLPACCLYDRIKRD